MVSWPEVQDYMEHPRWNECIFCQDIDGHPCPDFTYMIPEDIYKEVMYKLQFPKVYKNTNLGTIVCYEDKVVINEKDIYLYDEDSIKSGSKILIHNHNVEDLPEWIISKCMSCSAGFPLLLDDSRLCPGINCEIIGVNNIKESLINGNQ